MKDSILCTHHYCVNTSKTRGSLENVGSPYRAKSLQIRKVKTESNQNERVLLVSELSAEDTATLSSSVLHRQKNGRLNFRLTAP